jgi:heat shock protein HtpX
MGPHLDPEQQHSHKQRNMLHSGLLTGGIGLLMGLCAYLLWGWFGIVWAGIATFLMFALAPRVPPQAIMRMYGARRIHPKHGDQLAHIIEVLADRAELPSHPQLYIVPSMTLNAFATGRPRQAAIAITEGLLRRLELREVAGVLAHEMSHIRNNDLWVMGLADAMSRFTQALSYVAVVLFVVNLPGALGGDTSMPWMAIILLYFAPTVSSLLQLGLSRTREYDADLEGAMLTGDPIGLASALRKLERYQGRFWEDVIFPGVRRIPHPSLLRSHPATEDRIARLLQLRGKPVLPPIVVVEAPMVSLVGLGPGDMQPRYRWSGVWY